MDTNLSTIEKTLGIYKFSLIMTLQKGNVINNYNIKSSYLFLYTEQSFVHTP